MTFKQLLLAAAAIAPAMLAANAAQAQAVAVADPQAAMENTKAFQAAAATIRTTYASTITQVQTRPDRDPGRAAAAHHQAAG